MAKALIVLAHPLETSLCAHLAGVAAAALSANGHAVTRLDLAQSGFDPRLTAAERAAYHAPDYPPAAEASLLSEAEILVLVFPAWWFSPPALMKGFFDRVFSPGTAFAHGADFGPIRPLLAGLKHVAVITTLGSPWWADWLIMRRPVRRVLKWGLFKACAPQAGFRYLPFYLAENPAPGRVEAFAAKVSTTLARLS